MQYNTPQQERRPTRTDPATPNARRGRARTTRPKSARARLQKVLPLLLLFSALLIAIYHRQPQGGGPAGRREPL